MNKGRSPLSRNMSFIMIYVIENLSKHQLSLLKLSVFSMGFCVELLFKHALMRSACGLRADWLSDPQLLLFPAAPQSADRKQNLLIIITPPLSLHVVLIFRRSVFSFLSQTLFCASSLSTFIPSNMEVRGRSSAFLRPANWQPLYSPPLVMTGLMALLRGLSTNQSNQKLCGATCPGETMEAFFCCRITPCLKVIDAAAELRFPHVGKTRKRTFIRSFIKSVLSGDPGH